MAKRTVLGIGAVAAFTAVTIPVASTFAENESKLDINYNVTDNLSLTLSSGEAIVVDGSTAPTTTATVAGNSVYNLVVVDQDTNNAMTNGTGGRIEAAPLTGTASLTAGTWGIKASVSGGTTTLDSTKYYGVPARTISEGTGENGADEDISTPLTIMTRGTLADTAISGDTATITYGVSPKANQAAGTYTDTIIYTVSPLVIPETFDNNITSISPSVISKSTTTPITIETDIPSYYQVENPTITLKQSGGSTTYTCDNPTIDTTGSFIKINCTAPAASGTYNIEANLTVYGKSLTMTSEQTVMGATVFNIKWMYPTKMLTTGTQDKLVIATNKNGIPTTAIAEVTVDGSTCTNPQIVEGGKSSSATSEKYKYKFITCSAPAMSAGNHDVVATVTDGNTVYAFTGKSINYTNDTITNRLTSIPETTTGAGNHSMQKINELDTNGPDSSKTFCANSTTPVLGDAVELVPTAILTDERDSQQYTVRKLADGNCWMTENLRYGAKTDGTVNTDLETASNITSSNTDNPQTGFSIPSGRITTSNRPGSGWFDYGNNNNYTQPQIMITGANTANDYDLNNTKYGVLYNYCAATGGTVCYTSSMSQDAPGSICPANWKLPAMDGDPSSTTAIETATKDGTVKSYNNLLNNYDVNYKSWTYDSEFTKLTTNSLDFVRAGAASEGSLNRDASSGGTYWVSTAFSGSGGNAHFLAFNSGSVSRSGNSHYRGYSVRCVAS